VARPTDQRVRLHSWPHQTGCFLTALLLCDAERKAARCSCACWLCCCPAPQLCGQRLKHVLHLSCTFYDRRCRCLRVPALLQATGVLKRMQVCCPACASRTWVDSYSWGTTKRWIKRICGMSPLPTQRSRSQTPFPGTLRGRRGCCGVPCGAHTAASSSQVSDKRSTRAREDVVAGYTGGGSQ
jgi:hypothetical protein